MDIKSNGRKIGLAFYELSGTKRSSAEIINEARAEISSQRNGFLAVAPGGIHTVDTKRPFTPRESQRTLFGKAARLGVNRPSSAVNLRYLQSDHVHGECNGQKQWLASGDILLPHCGGELRSEDKPKPCIPNSWFNLNVSNRIKLPNLSKTTDLNLEPSRPLRIHYHHGSLKNLPEEEEEDKRVYVDEEQNVKQNISERWHYISSEPDGGENHHLEENLTNFEKHPIIKKSNVHPSVICIPCGKDLEEAMKNSSSLSNGIHSTSAAHYCDSFSKKSPRNYHSIKNLSCRKSGLTSSNQELDTNHQLIHITQALHLEARHENNESKVICIIQQLYKSMETNGFLNCKLASKTKTLILKSLYKFVERSNDELLLEVARVVLALCVRGSNLTGVCKLIFKVSRNDKNDHLFMKINLLELFVNALGTAEPMEDAEACIYGYGAIKFLTMNLSLLKKLLNFGILELMVLHMKVINKWRVDEGHISEQTSHALFQLTGALRNVAGEEEDPFPNAFVTSGLIKELCSTIAIFLCDVDIISNVSRTLSILSTHDICCSSIIEHENSIRTVIKLLKKYPGRQDIVVRLCYVLGNLMAKSDNARMEFYSGEETFSCLINLLYKYIDIDISSDISHDYHARKSYDASSESTEDVLVKIIRIIANLSISPIVGKNIVDMNEDQDGSDNLCILVTDALLRVLKKHQVPETLELLLSSLSTLNNLSFWAVSSTNGDFYRKQLQIAKALKPFIMDEHCIEVIVEAVRVFGNLTQSKEVRDYMVESGMLEKIILLLQDPRNVSKDLLLANIGVLVNMMADVDNRRIFFHYNGISRLVEILEMCDDSWNLSSLICQVIWNCTTESKNLYYDLGRDTIEKLVSVLADFLDEERYFGVPEGSVIDPVISMSYDYQLWEDFSYVATDLLEKIEAFLDSSFGTSCLAFE